MYSGTVSLGPSFSKNNAVLVTGSNTVWGSDVLWLRGASNSVTIASGATVYDNAGGVGIDGDHDTMVVTGSGSVWSNNGYVSVGDVGRFNSLTIANGGVVYGGDDYVGRSQLSPTSSSSNIVLVTDSGSVWSNGGTLYIGWWSAGNLLSITNGGAVYNAGAFIGTASGSNNAVLVSGNGSVWQNQGDLHLGWFFASSFNQLTIGTGGSVLANNAYLGTDSSTVGNGITIAGGSLCVTNLLGNSVLDVRRGTLTLNNGTVTVSQLLLTNGVNSVFTFGGGTLNCTGAAVTNGQTLVVGDGAQAANYHLQGGIHSFFNGLRIRNAALLTGCGTVNGSVTVDSGGTVVVDCGGTLTFMGSVTNNGTMRVVNGSVLEGYGTIVNNGTIQIIAGSTNFPGVFINNGSVVDASAFQIAGIVKEGDSVRITWNCVNGRTNTLQAASGDASGGYSNNFTDIFVVTNAVGSVTNYLDNGGATNKPARYYRVRLVP